MSSFQSYFYFSLFTLSLNKSEGRSPQLLILHSSFFILHSLYGSSSSSSLGVQSAEVSPAF